jgi:prepilin-type N-terminal cleavage/methylation domain-containing protein
MRKSFRYKLGFTIIELLTVVSIIGLMSSIVTSSLNSSRVKARDSLRLSQIREVEKALSLYYLNNGVYPLNTYGLIFDSSIPGNWSSMISDLNSANLIKATFSKADIKDVLHLSLAKVAFASAGGPMYYQCSIQDPLYKTADDYAYSYGYITSGDRQKYKIRMYLENTNNPILTNSTNGTFLDTTTTGNSACDKNLHYYCRGDAVAPTY